MKQNGEIKLHVLLERTGQQHDIQISAEASFDQLHQLIQEKFGWDNSHLYQFIVDGQYFISEDQEDSAEDELLAKDQKLTDVLSPGQELRYIYDLGDCWEHHITVKTINQQAIESFNYFVGSWEIS